MGFRITELIINRISNSLPQHSPFFLSSICTRAYPLHPSQKSFSLARGSAGWGYLLYGSWSDAGSQMLSPGGKTNLKEILHLTLPSVHGSYVRPACGALCVCSSHNPTLPHAVWVWAARQRAPARWRENFPPLATARPDDDSKSEPRVETRPVFTISCQCCSYETIRRCYLKFITLCLLENYSTLILGEYVRE